MGIKERSLRQERAGTRNMPRERWKGHPSRHALMHDAALLEPQLRVTSWAPSLLLPTVISWIPSFIEPTQYHGAPSSLSSPEASLASQPLQPSEFTISVILPPPHIPSQTQGCTFSKQGCNYGALNPIQLRENGTWKEILHSPHQIFHSTSTDHASSLLQNYLRTFNNAWHTLRHFY